MTSVRRVVTGQTTDGKSVFVSDDEVEATTVALVPGMEFHLMWGADEIPALPTDGSEPTHHAYFPPPGGYRFGFFTVPPEGGEVPADTAFLRQIAGQPRALEVGEGVQRPVAQPDTAGLDGGQAEPGPEQSGLARAVRPQKRENFARSDVEVDRFERNDAGAVLLVQAADR